MVQLWAFNAKLEYSFKLFLLIQSDAYALWFYKPQKTVVSWSLCHEKHSPQGVCASYDSRTDPEANHPSLWREQ